ncbi:hypothetical protein Leryth_004808 [Lithospermum erythrorhizon]|nr:hypothetical protein Leryth_004808 [Lithospermum erythrorhizon]
MASTAPPVLPVANNNQQLATAEAPPSAFRSFITRTAETIQNGLSNRRPWTELIDRSAFSKPDSVSDATTRIRKNYTYFRINYLTIITCVLGFSLITNPLSLLLLTSLLAAWLFLYLFRTGDAPLVIFGRQFSDRETLGGLILSTIVVIFLTSVGSVLVSALMIGVAVVCAHAAFRAPEDLFLDEQDSPATGFLSFLTGATANASAVTATPVVPARV